MAGKNFESYAAFASQRQIVASALGYGLSLALRLTSAAGGEAELADAAVSNSEDVGEESAAVRELRANLGAVRGRSVLQRG